MTITPPFDKWQRELCSHCGTPFSSKETGGEFCCSGCANVYQFLKDAGMDKYYSLRDSDPADTTPQPLVPETNFDYLDDPRVHEEFVHTVRNQVEELSFFVEGIHCTACIWLLEQLPTLCADVLHARLNYARSQLTVTLAPNAQLSRIAQTIGSLGYAPRLIHGKEMEEAYARENRELLYRLGVAGVAAGNTMMIAISLYEGSVTGIEPRFAWFFSLLSALIALPAILYSAQPFYRAALSALVRRRPHVDLPISLGIIVGYLLSLVSILNQSDAVYFDSLCILIFLMLGARFLQRVSLRRVAQQKAYLKGFLPDSVLVARPGGVREYLYRESVQRGDTVIVPTGERLPTDGVLLTETARLNTSVLTGESLPQTVLAGQPLYAGSTNVGSELLYRVTALATESRVNSFFEQNSPHRHTDSSLSHPLLEEISRWFVIAVIAIATLTFAYWWETTSLTNAMEVTLAFLIVTCPCALGLSTPLLLAKTVADGIRHGIFISDGVVFEEITRSESFFVDKTGTLTLTTHRSLELFHWDGNEWIPAPSLPSSVEQLVLALEEGIEHPTAASLRQMLKRESLSETSLSRKLMTGGVLGWETSEHMSLRPSYAIGSRTLISEHFPEICRTLDRLSSTGSITIGVFEREIYAFILREQLQTDAEHLVEWCRHNKKDFVVLSGDDPAPVHELGRQLELSEDSLFSTLSPEEKAKHIELAAKRAIMIGDGANDGPAFQASRVGIGLRGGVEQLLSVSDAYIQSGSIRDLLRLLNAAYRVRTRLHLSYTFAVAYNLAAGGAAVFGLISPLLAAILMPLSSLTVIALAFLAKPYSDEHSTHK